MSTELPDLYSHLSIPFTPLSPPHRSPLKNTQGMCLHFGILAEASRRQTRIGLKQFGLTRVLTSLSTSAGAERGSEEQHVKIENGVDQARSEPHRDAAHSTFVIEKISDLSRLRAMEELQISVWGPDNRTVVPSHLLALIAYTGGIVLGAFEGNEPVGFAFGLLAREKNRLYHASHMLGIHPRVQGTGIGAALKWRQRESALAQGLDLMTWTFDPLEARNAYFNLHKLGAISHVYHEDFYGEMEDDLNRGLPSDRLVVEWRLRDVQPGLDRPRVSHEGVRLIQLEGGRPVVQIPRERPVLPVLIDAPREVQRLKQENLELARVWRLAQREAFVWAFSNGYTVRDFADGAFVLFPDDGWAT